MIRKLIIKSKKGDKLISVYWFVILVLVATCIVLMVNTFYGNPYDVRNIESNILAQDAANCISFGGQVNPLLMTPQGVFRPDFRDKFMQRCSLNFTVAGSFTPTPYYLRMTFALQGETNHILFNISEGNSNLVPDCSIKSNQNSPKLSKCSQKEFFMKAQNNKVYLVKILAIVNKVNQNTN